MPKLYEIRVTLDEVEPAVWRTILIGDDAPMIELHASLQGAMGWNCSHMFAFEIGDRRFELQFGDGFDRETTNMLGVILRDVLATGDVLKYHYDFGDDWWHTLQIRDHRTTVKGDRPSRCVDGAGLCAPDDCGGPPGYAELKAIMADPDHPDHEEVAEWLGDALDAGPFDAKAATRDMRKLIKLHAEMEAEGGLGHR